MAQFSRTKGESSSEKSNSLHPQETAEKRRTSSISNEEMLEIQGEFVGLGEGGREIHVEELRTLLESMKIKLFLKDSEINKAIKQIDKNEDGMVCFDELHYIIEKYDTDGIIYKALSQRSKIREDFKKYDKDNFLIFVFLFL